MQFLEDGTHEFFIPMFSYEGFSRDFTQYQEILLQNIYYSCTNFDRSYIMNLKKRKVFIAFYEKKS